MTTTIEHRKDDPSVPHLTVTTYNLPPEDVNAAEDDMAVKSPAKALHLEKPDTQRISPSSPTCHGGTDPFETDVEAMMPRVECSPSATTATSCTGNPRKSIILPTVNDTSIWPGNEHWKREAKEARIKRSCTCLARLSKRNRTIAKVTIIFLVIAIAVGVGVGISRALNQPIYGQKDSPPTG